MSCPCGSGGGYDACCGRLHRGEAEAGTAEQLMRSRYSAYAVGDEAYLLRTWHPDARPVAVALGSVRWLGLEVVDVVGGGLLDTDGVVEFRAHHDGGTRHERSRFRRIDGSWRYVGEDDDDAGP